MNGASNPVGNLLVRGGRLVGPGAAADADVLILGGRIAAVGPQLAGPAGTPVLDAQDCWVTPGFVDLHVHAVDGHWANADGLPGLAVALASRGVTSFLATAATSPLAELAGLVRAAAQPPAAGARCLGVHLEGPWLSPVRAGAQPAEHLRAPAVAELTALLDVGSVRLVTIAPELPGAELLIKAARASGVTVALGHSDATYDQTLTAVGWGASQVTHAFNAMAPLHHRDPGLVGAAMDLAELTVEMIPDGEHLHPAVVRLLWRTCGVQRLCLVSDCVDGAAPGLTAGPTVNRRAGRLAGSLIGLAQGVANCVGWGIPLSDAVAMAATTPAAAIGCSDVGRLDVGLLGDLVVLDASLQVRHTVIGGHGAWSA